ncbi:transcriptional regulator [Staphylococcus aureus]|nr:hypothetical protein [Staphylococcus aureus]HAR3753469.1 transcriptional regulator [Staphylococcus aureus]HAR4089009.1 transcriptional regulator [Staphylococcus aureus]HDH6795848.1 transcriptional regulator [Staphylococcus aureus]
MFLAIIIFLSLFILLTSFFSYYTKFSYHSKVFTKKTYLMLTIRKFRIILGLRKAVTT